MYIALCISVDFCQVWTDSNDNNIQPKLQVLSTRSSTVANYGFLKIKTFTFFLL